MKKNIKIIILFVVAIVCIIQVFEARYDGIDRKLYVQQKLDEAHKYIIDKYGEELKVELLNYSLADGFIANYRLVDLPELNFRVEYWVNKDQYCDNYIQQVLTNEIRRILNDTLSECGLSNVDIDVGSMIGPPFDLTTRLYEYFNKLGRIPRLSDIKHKEKFLYVKINSNNELDENRKRTIEEVIVNLNLPVKRIELI